MLWEHLSTMLSKEKKTCKTCLLTLYFILKTMFCFQRNCNKLHDESITVFRTCTVIVEEGSVEAEVRLV